VLMFPCSALQAANHQAAIGLRSGRNEEPSPQITSQIDQGETAIGLGSTGQRVNDCVCSRDLDLTVMSTHGCTESKRFFSGTAEQILRHAIWPVLVVPNRPLQDYRHVGDLKVLAVPCSFGHRDKGGTDLELRCSALSLSRSRKQRVAIDAQIIKGYQCD
jgi:hypothetical protein